MEIIEQVKIGTRISVINGESNSIGRFGEVVDLTETKIKIKFADRENPVFCYECPEGIGLKYIELPDKFLIGESNNCVFNAVMIGNNEDSFLDDDGWPMDGFVVLRIEPSIYSFQVGDKVKCVCFTQCAKTVNKKGIIKQYPVEEGVGTGLYFFEDDLQDNKPEDIIMIGLKVNTPGLFLRKI